MNPALMFIFGSLLGFAAGLIPGIHPNLVAFLLSTLSANENIIYLVVPLAVINSIVDTIPSILFGAPDVGNELAVLPGHRMLMKGLGYDAVRRTAIGSLLSGVYVILLLPIAFLLSKSYTSFRIFIPIILVIISTYMILTDKNPIFASFCFVFSGLIGVLSSKIDISSGVVLLPILSGLFGLSRILISLRVSSVPPQREDVEFISSNAEKKSAFFGSFMGMLSGFIPGVGASQSAYVASSVKGDFLTSLGAITTSNVIFSFLSLYFINKIRSGVAASISFLDINAKIASTIIILSLMSIPVGVVMTLASSKIIIRYIQKINYRLVNILVGLFIILTTILISGMIGLLLLIVSTSLGLMAITKGVKQSNLLGVIIIPTIVYFTLMFI